MFGGRRLEHDLVLVVVLQPVRVVAVAPVLRPARGLHVGGVPGLRADGAQEGRGMEGAGADFHVVGLQQRASLPAPERAQLLDQLLEGQHAANSSGSTRGARITANARSASERQDDRPVAQAHVRRRARVSLRRDLEAALGELRQALEHAPVAVDRRGDAGIGRGEVHAPGLDRAQPRDLQVLRGRERVAEPGDVGDVDQQRRLGQRGARSRRRRRPRSRR